MAENERTRNRQDVFDDIQRIALLEHDADQIEQDLRELIVKVEAGFANLTQAVEATRKWAMTLVGTLAGGMLLLAIDIVIRAST